MLNIKNVLYIQAIVYFVNQIFNFVEKNIQRTHDYV